MLIEKKKEVILGWINKYEGEIVDLKKLIPTKSFIDAGWNKSSNIPVEQGTSVHIHPSQDEVMQGFVRVVYSEYKAIAIFSKNNFIWEQ
jgi:hypothetical protein